MANGLAQLNWSNSIAIKLHLSADSITSPSRPNPVYVLLPRQGFLCTVATHAWPHFQHVLPSLPGQQEGPRPWFDYKQLPLRGNLPLGVLFDMFGSAEDGSASLPWELTIHYTGLPEVLAGWHNALPQAAQFFHSLKEAAFIARGPDGSSSIMKMTGAAQDALWAAVEAADTARYKELVSGLRLVPAARQEGAAPGLPCRLIVRTSAGPLLSAWDDAFITSRPCPAINPDGSWTTLGQLLASLLPHLRFTAPPPPPPGACAGDGAPADAAPSGSAGGSVTGGVDGGGATGTVGVGAPLGVVGAVEDRDGCESASASVDAESSGGEAGDLVGESAGEDAQGAAARSSSGGGAGDGDGAGTSTGQQPPLQGSTGGGSGGGSNAVCEAVVCGVVPPLESPLAWLHAHLHAADHFLYVVMRRAASGSGRA
ncbi:hypothetical protein FOA52_004772 [Chlamydomonas sp. UWO 241]|nr:hypothetical protein FOA52_004772 [Chlamydomonas sp. UWO 241]